MMANTLMTNATVSTKKVSAFMYLHTGDQTGCAQGTGRGEQMLGHTLVGAHRGPIGVSSTMLVHVHDDVNPVPYTIPFTPNPNA